MNLTRQPLMEPKSQPPPLDNSLSLDNISSTWRLSDEQSNNSDPSRCPNSSELMEDHCVFAWMSEISFAHSARLKRYTNRHIRTNRGWDFVNDNQKPGFGASKAKASFSIELRDINKEVKAINIVSMKSYDAKWRGSKVEMQVFVQKRGTSTETSVGKTRSKGIMIKEQANHIQTDLFCRQNNPFSVEITIASNLISLEDPHLR